MHLHSFILRPFDFSQQLFYFSVSFSEDKIAECQEGEYELVIKAGSDHSMSPILINKSNFAPDSPVRFPLRLSSNSCYISIRSRKNANAFTSYYELLKPIEFPTFFKFQPSYSDVLIAKRHTDGIIYTETHYYVIASQKNHIEKLINYSPDVSAGTIEKISALGSTIYGAEIVISAVSAELRDTMQYFGYYLRKAERITMLWPPSYTADGELRCRPGKIFLTSTYDLRPRSNITCDFQQISNNGELYAIDFLDSLRISQANTTLQISSETTDIPVLSSEPRIEATTIVEVGEGQAFYYVGKDGYRLLFPGHYHLTAGTKIVQCIGNYQIVVYILPETQKTTSVKKLMDIRKYYNVTMPYSDDLIAGIYLSKVADIYIEDCRNTGTINVKALEYIRAGTI